MSSSKIQKAQAILNSLAWGDISNSVYDQAWILRSGCLTSEERNQLVGSILKQQHSDGSWGGALPYIHDRVINTLGAVIAFKELALPTDDSITKALVYLSTNIPRLREEEIETIGFELLFPALLKQAKEYQIDLPYTAESVMYYHKLRDAKLELLPKSIFRGPSTITHSIEAFFDQHIELCDHLLFENGSMGGSPSATSYYVKKVGAQNALKSVEYLKQFKANDWTVPSIYPFEIFEKAWVLYNFLHAGILHQLDYKKHTDYLWTHWQKFNGASISNQFPVVDSDDSAVVYIVLKSTGYPVKAESFEKFEQDQWFRCFDLERNPSISANIHLLEAFKISPEYPRCDEVINKILTFLKSKRSASGFWVDKWHISPYYCTAHAVLALQNLDTELLEDVCQMVKAAQRQDGGWGKSASTFEETSYALQALRTSDSNFQEEIQKSNLFLKTASSRESLWVDKGLYAPKQVINSFI